MARGEIARGLVGAVQWLGVGLLGVFVVILGLVWPDDQTAGGQHEVSAAPAELDDDPVAEIEPMPVDLAGAEQSEDDVLDALEAEGDESTVSSDVPQVGIPRGVIERVDGDAEWIVHTVVPFESVQQIAYRYDVRPEALRLWNGIRAETNRLGRRSKLQVRAHRIPPQRVRIEYVVKLRDSWWSIGIRYGVDSVDLRRYNRHSPRRLEVGQKIHMWIDPVVFEWIAVEDDSDPQTLRPGAVGIGPPDDGALVNGVRIPDSEYYTLRLPPSSYGTTHAVEQFTRAIVLFEARSDYERALTLGSMSAKHGGPLKGHRSHQTGRDLDIRLPLSTRYPDWFSVEPKRVDWTTLWHLVTAFADTDEVVVIFFDYDQQEHLHEAAVRAHASQQERRRILQWPRGDKAHRGLVRHSPGHDRHIHVRFTCGIYEVECTGHGAEETGD